MRVRLLKLLGGVLGTVASVSVGAATLLLTPEGAGTARACASVGDVTINASGQIVATVPVTCFDAPTSGETPATNYTLTVTKSGAGQGNVSSTPAGITCPSVSGCSAAFDVNAVVELLAAPTDSSTVSWAGCQVNSTDPLKCSVTMGAARAVTATFTASGGAGGEGDPGSSTALWKPNGSTYVFNRGGLSELFVPRCVPDQYTNCRLGAWQTTKSIYDSVKAGEVWSMRIPFAKDTVYKIHTFKVERSETGETITAFDMAISTVPGEFNVAPACRSFPSEGGGSAISVHDSQFPTSKWVVSCPLTSRDTVYYLNMRPATGTAYADSAKCGSTAAFPCRFKVMLPSGFPYMN